METTPAGGGALQLLLLLALLIPAIFFLITQQNTLKAIKPENRLMHPGLVWLQLIPLFGQIWMFFVVVKIAASVQLELISRDSDSILGFADAASVEATGQRPTQAIGIAECTMTVLAYLIQLAEPRLALFSMVLWLAAFVCWIIYWVQLAGYKNKLAQPQA